MKDLDFINKNIARLTEELRDIFKELPNDERDRRMFEIGEELDSFYILKEKVEVLDIMWKHHKIDYIENTNINELGKEYDLFICEINSIEDREDLDKVTKFLEENENE